MPAHKQNIIRFADRFPKHIRTAFFKGVYFGGKNPYQNTSKVNGGANYGKAFYNAFEYGKRYAKEHGLGQQIIKFD